MILDREKEARRSASADEIGCYCSHVAFIATLLNLEN